MGKLNNSYYLHKGIDNPDQMIDTFVITLFIKLINNYLVPF